MNLEIIKYLIPRLPNWAGTIILSVLGIKLIFETIQTYRTKKEKKESTNKNREISSDPDRDILEEREAAKRFYKETGIWCNKNLRDGLNWLHEGSGSKFSWSFIRASINYLREQDGRFGVKVSWFSVLFEHLCYVFIVWGLISAGAVWLPVFNSGQQTGSFSLLIMTLSCLGCVLYLWILTFPIWRARRIAKAVRRLDPDNPFLEIPKLFDPIYGAQSSLIKPHHIEQLKRLSSHLKHLKRLPRKN